MPPKSFARGAMLARQFGGRIAREAVELADHPIEDCFVDVLRTLGGEYGRGASREIERARGDCRPCLGVGTRRSFECAGGVAAEGEIHLPTVPDDGHLGVELVEIGEARRRKIGEIDLVDVHLADIGVAGGEHAGRVGGVARHVRGDACAAATRRQQQCGDQRRHGSPRSQRAECDQSRHNVGEPPRCPSLMPPRPGFSA